jgi:predicted MarR family transcription regulator
MRNWEWEGNSERKLMAKRKEISALPPSELAAERNLVSRARAMSEFELALIVVTNTFNQWVTRCGSAAGITGLSTLDMLVMHFLCNRRRSMRAADIAFALSIEDIHLVVYSLKKLVRLQLMSRKRRGNEMLYSVTETADATYERYQGVRRKCLIKSLEMLHDPEHDLSAITGMLRALAGIYEQAARTAAINP